MKTLKEFIANRKYVAVKYDKESQEKLIGVIEEILQEKEGFSIMTFERNLS